MTASLVHYASPFVFDLSALRFALSSLLFLILASLHFALTA
jgi:hypothetical protein